MEPRSLMHTHTHTQRKTQGFMASIYLPFMLEIQWRPKPWSVLDESELCPHSPPRWILLFVSTELDKMKWEEEKRSCLEILQLWEQLSFGRMDCHVWVLPSLFNTSTHEVIESLGAVGIRWSGAVQLFHFWHWRNVNKRFLHSAEVL